MPQTALSKDYYFSPLDTVKSSCIRNLIRSSFNCVLSCSFSHSAFLAGSASQEDSRVLFLSLSLTLTTLGSALGFFGSPSVQASGPALLLAVVGGTDASPCTSELCFTLLRPLPGNRT